MNQMFGQSADPVRSSEVDLGPSSVNARPLPVGGAEQAFFHLDIKRSLYLHWRLARNVAIAGVVLGVLYFLSQALVFKSWPSYQAESLVYVKPTPPKVLESSQGGAPRWPFDVNTYETYIQQQMMNVSRNDVLASAVQKLKGWKNKGESDQAAAQRLVRSLTVTRQGAAYQFSIGARASTPQMAAQVANAVTAAYTESATRDERTGDSQRLSMLREERDRIQNALVADRNEQETLNKQLGVASVGGAVPDHYDEDISGTRTELIKARTDHDVAAAKFTALDAGHGPSSAAIDAEADELIASDAGLVSMKQALNTRRATLISQMANLTPSNPAYKQDEVELGKINNTLDAMMKDLRAKAAARIQLQLQADLQRTAGVESQLNGHLRQLVSAAGSATPKMQRSSDLAADITRLQARFANVDESLHNLILEDNGPAASYQVTPAVAPLNRTKSGVVRNAFLIVLAGLFFGVLAAVLAHKLDPKVYIARDVELILGFPPMALLPDFNEVSDGVVEEYLLRLASSIEHARKQSNLRSCVFTGASSGAGVSTLVNRVLEMLDAMGRPTVLVDATGAVAPTPRDHSNASGDEDSHGLVHVERVSRPTALLQQMAEETEMQDESLVLTDTAPLAVSAETEYLARFVDCAIVVIESAKTTRRELREAAATLQRLDVSAVGFVLNRVGLAKADPAFRHSIEAIEKHLQAQGKNVARRTRRSRSFTQEQPEDSVPLPNEGTARALFEPEVAAAAAAVARFSSPAAAETAACLPSPMYSAPVAESAKRFSFPMTVEPTISVSHPPVNEPADEPAVVSSSPLGEESAAPLASATASAPFVEAANHFSSFETPEPEDTHSFTTAATPFSGVPEHFSTPVDDEPEIPVWTLKVSEPVDEAAMHSSSPADAEPVAPVFTPVDTVRADCDWLWAVPEEQPVEATAAAAPMAEPEPYSPPEPILAMAEPEPASEPEPIQAAAEPDSDVPWWLTVTNRKPASTRPPVLWQPAKVWMSQKKDVAREPWPVGQNSDPEPLKSGSSSTAVSDRTVASEHERAPGAYGAPRTEAPNREMQQSEAEEAPVNLTSRLSGLRNLLFVLGVKDAHAPEEQPERQPSTGSNFDLRNERTAADRVIPQDAANATPINVGGASPRLVTAPPEFLPPKSIVINVDREEAHAGESSTRQDRRAAYDGLEILPSRRGQYKKI
jgi:capsular polysaccharide biosynthesis protein